MATIGRPVVVVSLGFKNQPLDRILAVVHAEGERGADLICLPETLLGQADSPEDLSGPTVAALAAAARTHRAYVVCPIDRVADGRRINSAVIIDRDGEIACVYDKVYPYWSEFDLSPPVSPGTDVPVYEADFGRVGLAICFDVNFPSVWQALRDQQAELVVWPSAYSGGAALQAYALLHHYYVVTSTQVADCAVYDITGEEVRYERDGDVNVSRFTLDLDRGIYHENFNIDKRTLLLREHPDDVVIEKDLDREQWFVLKARRPGVSARELARSYGLEELRDYLDRSRRQIDEIRGTGSEGVSALTLAEGTGRT